MPGLRGLSAGAPGPRALAGGQFELAPGRLQAQLLAALFHPDAPNDLAPVAYHDADPGAGAPASPLAVRAFQRAFGQG